MKKSIFKASFEESLNLLDDASLQYIKKDYYEKLGKGLNNGKPSIGFRIKSILYSVLFVEGTFSLPYLPLLWMLQSLRI